MTPAPPETLPLRARLRSHPRYRWIALSSLLFGLFAVSFNFTVLTVVLEDMAHEFDTTLSTMQWVVSLPILAFGVISPSMGKLADIFGAKRVYMLGFASATVLLLLTGVAWSAPALIIIRTIASVEGAATGPAALKFIATMFGPDERPKALGWWSTIAALGPSVGLAVGALVIPALGWRVMFLAQAPLCLIALVVSWLVLDETKRQPGAWFDYLGSFLLGAGILCGMLAIDRIPKWGFTDPRVLLLVVASPAVLAAFVWWQRRTTAPMFPLRYFRRRNFSVALASSAFVNFAYLGGFILSVPLMENVLGYDQAQSNLVVITRPLTFAIVASTSGYLIARRGERPFAVLGAMLIGAALVVLALVGTDSPMIWMMAGLAISGVGLGFSQPAVNSLAVNSLELDDQGVGGGLASSVMTIGSSVGTVVMVSIQQALEPDGLVRSFSVAYFVGAAVAFLAGFLSLLFRRRRITELPARTVAAEAA